MVCGQRCRQDSQDEVGANFARDDDLSNDVIDRDVSFRALIWHVMSGMGMHALDHTPPRVTVTRGM